MTDDAVRQAELGPPLVYGVWIEGQGWLRGTGGRVFADMRREYAEEVLHMHQASLAPYAKVVLFDEAMGDLELLFLEREKQALQEMRRVQQKDRAFWKARHERRFANRIRKFLHVLLERRSSN